MAYIVSLELEPEDFFIATARLFSTVLSRRMKILYMYYMHGPGFITVYSPID